MSEEEQVGSVIPAKGWCATASVTEKARTDLLHCRTTSALSYAAHAARRMQTRAVSNIRTRMAQKIAEQGNLQFFMPADHHPIDYRDQVRCVTFPAVRRA